LGLIQTLFVVKYPSLTHVKPRVKLHTKAKTWPLQAIRLFIRGLCASQYYSWHLTPPLLQPPPRYMLQSYRGCLLF